jgi:hypothetical protein
LLYSAAEHDVDLRIVPLESAWTIEGQVLGPEEGAQVLVTPPDGQALPALRLDELGGFRITGLSAGRHKLEIRFADTVVELPPLDLGAPAADA